MSEIFLSYDSQDLDKARELASALKGSGWTVFFDRTIPPGQTWRQFIGKEIAGCRCMVVAWSTNSISSHWVCEEADIGLKRKILVPILLDPVSPPLGFGSLQAANLVDWQGETESSEYLALTDAVTDHIGPPELPVSKVDEQRNGVETKNSFVFWSGILVTSILIAAIVIWLYFFEPKPGGNEVSLEIWIGEKVYDRAFGRGCGACHDVSGNPNLFESVKTLSKDEFIAVLKNGRNGMPKATETIMAIGPVKKAGYTKDQAYDALYAYIKGRSDNSVPEGKLEKAK